MAETLNFMTMTNSLFIVYRSFVAADPLDWCISNVIGLKENPLTLRNLKLRQVWEPKEVSPRKYENNTNGLDVSVCGLRINPDF